jgi:hypothetical protein
MVALGQQEIRQVGGANVGEVLDASAMQKEQESRKILTASPQSRRAIAGADAVLLIVGERQQKVVRERQPPVDTLLRLNAPPDLELGQQSKGGQILLQTGGHRVGPTTGRISPVGQIALYQVN